MKKVTAKQIKMIHVLLPDVYRYDKERKADFVFSFTEDETRTSTKDLTIKEAEHMIHFLQTGEKPDYSVYARFEKGNKQHMALLSLCYDASWTTEVKDRLVPDLNKLGRWISVRGHLAGQPLAAYKGKDMSKLIYQFEKTILWELQQNSDTE